MMEFCFFSFKKVITRMFSLILFLGCASFVTYRGYECFQKYLEKPEAIDVAFKSSGSQVASFPSITFCSYKRPLKENILKECNLTLEDYLEKNMWVGKGHSNCTDPKILRDQTIYGLDDLKMEIDYFSISTYDNRQLDSYLRVGPSYRMYPNDSRFHWTKFILDSKHTCLSMTLPKMMVELGINYFDIFFKLWPYLYISWNEDGLSYSDMPDSCPEISTFNGNGYYIPIGHETLELLEYDGETCEKSKDYRLDKCRYEFIEKVDSSTGSSLHHISLLYHSLTVFSFLFLEKY
jgi:hypothetical protein